MTALLPTFVLQEGKTPGIFLVHGFASDHRAWTAVADALPRGRQVLAVDLPGLGHAADLRVPGRSHRARWMTTAQWLGRSIEAAGAESFVVAGYSLGARLCAYALAAGVWTPRGALLESPRFPLRAAAARRARRFADEQLAQRCISQGQAAFAAAFAQSPVLAQQAQGLPADAVARLQSHDQWRLLQQPDGTAWNLRTYGLGSTVPVGANRYAGPVHLWLGAADPGCLADRLQWQRVFPQARVTVQADGPHNLHIACPSVWRQWLEELVR